MKRSMRMAAGVAALVGGGLLPTLWPDPVDRLSLRPRLGGGCPDPFPRAPLVVHDVSGTTHYGPFHTQLVVYADGHATYASGAVDGDDGLCRVRSVDDGAVASLANALAGLGAAGLCDDDSPVLDVPLATVTFFHEGADGTEANSFSYFPVVGGPWGEVEALLADFVLDHFGDAPAVTTLHGEADF